MALPPKSQPSTNDHLNYPQSTISHRHWLILALVFLALIGLPFVLGFLVAGKDYVFNGFLFNAGDSSSYLAKMYEGWNGSWRFVLPYTADPGQGGYIFLFYLFLGHLARGLGLPLLVIYHTVRLVSGVLMLAALANFMNVFIGQRGGGVWRALLWAAVGSGLGWLVMGFGLQTSDTWVVDAFPFLSAFSIPHFALSLALMLWIFSRTLLGRAVLTWRGAVLEFLAALLMGIISPFSVVVMLVVLGADALWRWWLGGRNFWREKSWLRLVWIALGGAPMLLYQFWLTRIDPILAAWNAQNITPSPAPWDILIAFSPALLLAIPGSLMVIRQSLRTRHNPGQAEALPDPARLLVVWAVLGLALLYFPFSLQRRFILGLYIPLVGLAVLGLDRLKHQADRIWALAFGLSLPTNVIILALLAINCLGHNPVLYMTRAEADAMAWIRTNTSQTAIILAAPDTGTLIPADTGRRVIYGHEYETVNAAQEKQTVEDYFSGQMSAAQAAYLLSQRKIDVVFCGPREQALSAGVSTSGDPSPGCPIDAGLPVLFREGAVILYSAH